MSPDWKAEARKWEGFPRTRGDEPPKGARVREAHKFSPHTRG